MQVRITKLRDDVPIPAYQTPGAAGFDLAISETVTIGPHAYCKAPTGLVIATPTGHVLIVSARGSLFKKAGLILANGIGVIDSDFRGPTDEIIIPLYNPGDEAVTVEKGMRIAQGLIMPVQQVDFEQGIAEGPDRGGFGSTG